MIWALKFTIRQALWLIACVFLPVLIPVYVTLWLLKIGYLLR